MDSENFSIEYVRRVLGCSQLEIAWLLGRSRASVSMAEGSHRSIPPKSIPELVRIISWLKMPLAKQQSKSTIVDNLNLLDQEILLARKETTEEEVRELMSEKAVLEKVQSEIAAYLNNLNLLDYSEDTELESRRKTFIEGLKVQHFEKLQSIANQQWLKIELKLVSRRAVIKFIEDVIERNDGIESKMRMDI